jgi:hypothetical protein
VLNVEEYFEISLVAIIGYFGYEFYRDYYKLGFDTRPEMPAVAVSMSFKTGFEQS